MIQPVLNYWSYRLSLSQNLKLKDCPIWCRFTASLRVSAMAAGVTDRVWEVSDLVALLEAEERGMERAA